MTRGDDPRRFLTYLRAERQAGRLYRDLAALTSGERAEALLELAAIEDRHAAHWEETLRRRGLDVPPDDGTLDAGDARLLARARSLSLDVVLGDLEQAERDSAGRYDDEPEALPSMSGDERSHAATLARLRSSEGQKSPAGASTPEHGRQRDPREVLNQAEPWHRADKSGAVRAAVFGVSDGLVSNTALVMGFAGSGTGSSTVLFAGVAGLLAGAFSMAAGEFVSVSSQRDLFRRELDVEAQELREKPLEEQRELELLYRAKGLDRDTARKAAARIMSDPATALDTLAREELGLDPDDLGSPVKVAASSFAAFAVGAIVPVVPYLPFLGLSPRAALIVAVSLAVAAMLLVGGVVGRLSGRGVAVPALRQLAVGGGAAVVTYVIGSVVGIGIG